MFLSAVTPAQPVVAPAPEPVVIVAATTTEAVAKKEIPPATNDGVEAYVRDYFADTPILADISRCESHFRQYSTTGGVFHGEIVYEDLGVMQINEYYHGAEAKKLGYDLTTIDGNLAFARYLYEKQGTQPWSASAACWNR